MGTPDPFLLLPLQYSPRYSATKSWPDWTSSIHNMDLPSTRATRLLNISMRFGVTAPRRSIAFHTPPCGSPVAGHQRPNKIRCPSHCLKHNRRPAIEARSQPDYPRLRPVIPFLNSPLGPR